MFSTRRQFLFGWGQMSRGGKWGHTLVGIASSTHCLSHWYHLSKWLFGGKSGLSSSDRSTSPQFSYLLYDIFFSNSEQKMIKAAEKLNWDTFTIDKTIGTMWVHFYPKQFLMVCKKLRLSLYFLAWSKGNNPSRRIRKIENFLTWLMS